MGSVSLQERFTQMGRDMREEVVKGRQVSGSFFCRAGQIEHLLAEVAETLGRHDYERREGGQAGGLR
jgi:hypothetical protein